MKKLTEFKLRSNDVIKELCGVSYKEVNVYKKEGKLPSGVVIMGRMMSLCKVPEKGQTLVSRDDASKIVAHEISQDWIEKNVYPISERSIAKKIKDDYETFIELRKVERREDKLKTVKWIEKVNTFNKKMVSNAYNVRNLDKQYEKKMEKEFGVKISTDDYLFYEDNCHGTYLARTTPTVPRKWMKQKKRTIEREEAEDAKRQLMMSETALQADVNRDEVENGMFEIQDSEDDNVTFQASPKSTTHSQAEKDTTAVFPQIKIREGYRRMNEQLMRCMVNCLANYKVTTNDLYGITVAVANTVFGQQWQVSSATNIDDGDIEEDVDDDNDYPDEKHKKSTKDRTYVMPSRRCLSNWLEAASFLNLQMVARSLIEKNDNVVTIGLDDTTKAAGHKMFDVKTDHITICGPNGKKTMTTGYIENVSHAGSDAAEAYEYKLQSLAILAGTSVDEIKQHIDFWMTDRAADCSKMLECMEIQSDKILKCCAHVILGVDSAIDKVFRDSENRIGLENLIDCGKILKSSSSSVHSVGLIAITKLLSPSHASHSVSLYNEYLNWMEENGIKQSGFKGFVSNRFGRIVELAKLYLQHEDYIKQYFTAVVDENSNKLVLAVSTFIDNAWFKCCTEVYSAIGDLLIFPLMNLIGIDGRGDNSERRSWEQVRFFFQSQLQSLELHQKNLSNADTGKGRLIGAVLREIIEMLKRQLYEMDFFKPETEANELLVNPDIEKLRYAPLTNLGCESQLGKLDNRIKFAGGMTTIATHSRMNIVSVNGLLCKSEFIDLTDEEKKIKWKWAKGSETVLKVKQLEEDFLSTVKASKGIALKKKEDLKLKKNTRTLQTLETCKSHGGPVTASTIALLERLDQRELLTEICYLRNTVAPDIRQKRRVKCDNGKFRYETFSVKELRQIIKCTVSPEFRGSCDVESLLLKLLK